MFHQILDEAQAGDQLGALVRGVKRDDIKRGMMMAKPGTLKAFDHCESQVHCQANGDSEVGPTPTHSTVNS